MASLAHSIQYGSKGKWGRIAMPAHAILNGGGLKAMASWVMVTRP